MYDILAGSRAANIRNSHLISRLPLVDACGRIEDFLNFKTFLFQLYENDLKVKFQTHPLVLAVPFSWTEKDILMVKRIINELGIQLSCLIDSSKLIAYNYSKPNCILLNISASGTACVPIRNYEPLNEMKIFEPFNVSSIPHSMNFWDNIYGALRVVLMVPPTPLEQYETMKEKWEGITYGTNYGVEVNYNQHVFEAETLLTIGNQLFVNAFKVLRKTIKSLQINSDSIEDVLICGGFSSTHGMKDRLTREIREIYPNLNLEFKSDEMEVIGGAKIICNLANFKQQLEPFQLE